MTSLRRDGKTYDSENPGLACCAFASPGEVAGLQAKRAELGVSSTDTDRVNALGAELGVGGLTTELELSLLAVVGALGTRGRTFVPGGTGDTYKSKSTTITTPDKQHIVQRTEKQKSAFVVPRILIRKHAATHPCRES